METRAADSSGRLDLAPEQRAWRRTLLGLGVAALVSALVALVLVMLWQSQLESLQPAYFREQGIQWGGELERRIREKVDDFIASADQARLEDWRRELPLYFGSAFEADFERAPALRPRELSLQLEGADGRRATVARVGRDLDHPPSADAYEKDDDSGLMAAVAATEPLAIVVITGPIIFEEKSPAANLVGKACHFHAILEFRPFQDVARSGTTYAAILVIIYLAILYGVLIFVFVLGRRQMQLSFSAQEKAIRLGAISSVAEGIAHEVRNPLNAISLNVQYLEKLAAKGHEPQSKDYQRVYRELGKIRKVIDNFVNFAKLRDLDVTDFSLEEVIEQAVAALGAKVDDLGVEVTREVEGELSLSADRPKIANTLTSILDNAIESARESETPRVDIRAIGDSRSVTVSIRDHGPVPDEQVIRNIFDPYFTTKVSSMGLGLTLAKTVVRSHGGRIEAAAAPGGGLIVTITLPREF